MIFVVRFTPEAQRQLDELETHIAVAASPSIAARYIDRIVDYCEELRTFPLRGVQRDDIRQGLRTLGYRRRVTIAFEVSEDAVTIIGIFYGGQDFEAVLQDDEE